MTVIIDDERAQGGRVLENPESLRFALHWGLRIRACRPYRAQAKDQAAHCTFGDRFEAISFGCRRVESFRPCCLVGGSSPGGR